MPHTIAFVPVRGGSKSIPKKNILPFCGRPLVYWVLEALENSSHIDEVIVATDDGQIEDTVLEFGFSKLNVFQRSAENAQDHSSTESVMLEFLEQKEYHEDDFFVLVQATSPFTTSAHFDEAFQLLLEKKADSLLTCTRVKRFFWQPDGQPKNYDFRNRPRRQDFDGELMENGAFYVNRVANVLQGKNRLSGKIVVYEMPEHTSLELDEPTDWLIGEELMRTQLATEKVIKPIKLFLTDVDGVLTDAGMYYGEDGNELKKFNTRDGKGIELLRNAGIKTGIITSENTELVARRAEKLKVDHLFQGAKNKLEIVRKLCEEHKIGLEEVAYIGDDLNDFDVLSNVGLRACPADAMEKIRQIPGILILDRVGGSGAVREFVDAHILKA